MDPQKSDSAAGGHTAFLDYWRILRIRKTIIITVFCHPHHHHGGHIHSATDLRQHCRIRLNLTSFQTFKELEREMSRMPHTIPISFRLDLKSFKTGCARKVIKNLDLNTSGAKNTTLASRLKLPSPCRCSNGECLSTGSHTKLIEITVQNEDRDEAALIANTITEAYRDYRVNLRKDQSQRGIKTLEDQYQEDEQKINVVQLKVDNCARNCSFTTMIPAPPAPRPR